MKMKNKYDGSFYTQLHHQRDKIVDLYLKNRKELSGLEMMFMGRKNLMIHELKQKNELLEATLSGTEEMVKSAIIQCQEEQNKIDDIAKQLDEKLSEYFRDINNIIDIPKIKKETAVRLDLYSPNNMFDGVNAEVVKLSIPSFEIAYLRDLIYDEKV
ncbi:MAG: hypothetical protein RBR93_12690 [Aliarcobacter butzleri]|nr:hypothetical protein [Aliarcobacter butzleri]